MLPKAVFRDPERVHSTEELSTPCTLFTNKKGIYTIYNSLNFDISDIKFMIFRLKALYKGLVPKVLRLGPGGAIMLVVYDYMHTFLMRTLKD